VAIKIKEMCSLNMQSQGTETRRRKDGPGFCRLRAVENPVPLTGGGLTDAGLTDGGLTDGELTGGELSVVLQPQGVIPEIYLWGPSSLMQMYCFGRLEPARVRSPCCTRASRSL